MFIKDEELEMVIGGAAVQRYDFSVIPAYENHFGASVPDHVGVAATIEAPIQAFAHLRTPILFVF